MRNFLNFMGKSLMVLVFSFLTLSVVLTSCSSDDSSESTQVDLNNLGLDPIYVPDENDLDSLFKIFITSCLSNIIKLKLQPNIIFS